MKYQYWLSNIPGVGCKTIHRLLGQAGSAEEIYFLKKEQLEKLSGLSDRQVHAITDRKKNWNLEEKYAALGENGISFLSCEMAVEAVILTVAFWALLFLVEKRKVAGSLMEWNLYESDPIRHPYAVAVTLIFTVALMTCIFATLDNAVTLGHAGGSMDIGQWPRLILAVSGLVSGVLFDYEKGRYRNLIMYCVTLLSTVCILVIVSGGSFLLGLIVFYLSAGFFVVFFSTGFVRLAGYMRVPQFWAGMGRAVNNLCAILIGSFSVALIRSGDSTKIMIASIGLFVLISIAIYIYTVMGQTDVELPDQERKQEEEQEYFSAFADTYALTEREQEVLKMLLASDEEVQEIANRLYISRAMLYRYISSLNKKTDTNSRIGLIQFYYTWKPEKKADRDD